MTNTAKRINEIDSYVIEKIEDDIPDHTWGYVINSLTHKIIDCLPTQIVLSIAFLYLSKYYIENKDEIIPDSLELIGIQETVNLLEELELKTIPFINESTIDKDGLLINA